MMKRFFPNVAVYYTWFKSQRCCILPAAYFLFFSFCVSFQSLAQKTFPVLQKYTYPNPSPAPPGDVFAPSISGTAAKGTPVIAEWTRTAGPNESIVFSGANFSSYSGASYGKDARFVVYGTNTVKDAQIQRLDSNKGILTLDKNLSRSMYLIWPKNSKGFGSPIVVNKTEAWWIGPDKATRGDTVSVYGRNLSRNNGTTTSYVYLKLVGGSGRWVSVTAVNPYKVDFIIPIDLANGVYEVWVHNGHGGKYGWSSALKLHIEGSFQWTSTLYNVKTYGAKGNGIADDTKSILAALDAARNTSGSTIYFPAGTYLISNTLELSGNTKWQGDGKTKTFLKCVTNFAANATSIIYANATNVAIHDMSFYRNTLSLTNNIDKVFNMRGSSNVHIADVNFSFAGFDVLDLNECRSIFIKNCSIIAMSAFLGNCSQLFIDKCSFKLTYDSDAMLASWNGQEISITNSTCSDLDNTNPNSGAGWGKGRFFVASGIWGSNRYTYLGQNTTTNLTVRLTGPDLNSGEQFLWEGNETAWSGTVVSATAASVTLTGLTGLKTDACYAVVVKGKGFGQWRRITRYANGTITLDEPWNLIPDNTSTINIGAYADKIVVYKNYLDAKAYAATYESHIASAGIEPYGGVFNMIADNNTFKEVRTGIANWALNNKQGIDPNFFNLFTNNTFINCRWAIFNSASVTTAKGITALFGSVFRRNNIKAPVIAGVSNDVDADFPVLSTVVYEHNAFNGIPKGIESGTRGIDNQMYYQNNFNSVLSSQQSAIQITPRGVLRQNIYQGLKSLYKDSLPGVLEAPYHVIELEGRAMGNSIDSSFIVWNSGATPLNWTATSSASWLTLSSASGSIQNERGSSIIKFKVNPKDLQAGNYTATLTITAFGTRKSYTVLLRLTGISTCANTGTISWDYWANLTPNAPISDIPVNSTPTSSGELKSFAIPVNIGNNFGARVRGYICPPVSGNYVFYIASDDYSELWLSTSESSTEKLKIASVPAWTNPYVYTKYASQQSKAVFLEQGKRYYVEALMRNNYGADHLSVGWKMPDGKIEQEISGSCLVPFTRSTISTFSPVTYSKFKVQ